MTTRESGHVRGCRRFGVGIVLGCLAVFSSACIPRPDTGGGPHQASCSSEFALRSNEQPLGSTADFLRVAEEMAVAAGTTTSLDEIARSARWPDGRWDRVVMIGGSSTSADVNELAGTTGICFHGLGSGDYDSGFDGYYVFFDGPTPRQSAPTGSRPVIVTDASPVVDRDQPLVSDTTVKRPVLRTTPAGP
ncbi:hypothetical protein [Gordonia aurantiaca]|uniref:hypothetical protein n=1 Tax=Gordonia sp. B21 TaxID=3151852 RepID=UPI003267AB44